MKAHIQGGVPKKEWKFDLLRKYGISNELMFSEKNPNYFDFKDVKEKQQIREILEKSKGFIETDNRLKKLVLNCFTEYAKEIRKLRESVPVHELLEVGFESVQGSLNDNGVLDEFQTRGLFINWWNNNKFELRTIKDSGWKQSLVSNFDFSEEDTKELELTLEKAKYFFKNDFENEIRELDLLDMKEGELYAEVEEEIRAEELENEEDAEPRDKVLKTEIDSLKTEIKQANKSDQINRITELRKLLVNKESELAKIIDKQSALKQIRKEIKCKNEILVKKIQKTIDDMSEVSAERMIIKKFENSCLEILNGYLVLEKEEIIAYFENLWTKYSSDIRAIEKERDVCDKELNNYLEALGYEQ